MIPYLRTVVDIVSGFSQKDISWEKLEKAVNEVKYSVAGNGKIWPRNIYNISASIAAVFGVPYGNALKEIEAISRTLMHQFHGKNEFTDYLISKSTWKEEDESNQGKFMKYYKNAIQNGHPEEAELILSDYMAERFGGDFKNEKMAKVLKETARLYKDADKDEKSMVLYSLPDKDYTFDGKDKKISNSQYPEFVKKTYGPLWDLAYDFVTSKEYKEFSDDDKIRSFGELKSYVKSAQLAEDIDGYELKGWEKDVYSGEVTYPVNALERKNKREFKDATAQWREDNYDVDYSKYSEAEAGTVEDVGEKASAYYELKKAGKSVDDPDYRQIDVYDNLLSGEMSLEEYAGVRAYAKKTAAKMQGSETNMDSEELEMYLDSTEYSRDVKAALFEAIGNKGWKNPYTGKKVGEWKY